jgi:hypothetical protein
MLSSIIETHSRVLDAFSGRGIRDEEQPPPPLSPPTLAELMQTVVESQCMLAEAMRQMANREDRHVHQGPQLNQ